MSYPEDFPYDVYPTNGGILPWGRTDNGDTLNWIVNTYGDWAILVDGGSGDYFEYNGSMTGFLYGVLSSSIVCSIFQSNFPDKDSKNTFDGLKDE